MIINTVLLISLFLISVRMNYSNPPPLDLVIYTRSPPYSPSSLLINTITNTYIFLEQTELLECLLTCHHQLQCHPLMRRRSRSRDPLDSSLNRFVTQTILSTLGDCSHCHSSYALVYRSIYHILCSLLVVLLLLTGGVPSILGSHGGLVVTEPPDGAGTESKGCVSREFERSENSD